MLRLDWNLAFTIINLIVLNLLMKKFLIGPVTAIMEKRKNAVEAQFEGARKTQASALEMKQKYEDGLKIAREEAARIVEKARENGKAEYERIVEEAKAQADKAAEGARRAARLDEEKAMRDAESKIAGLVMAAAAKIVGEQSGQKQDQAIYDQFILKAGESYDANRS